MTLPSIIRDGPWAHNELALDLFNGAVQFVSLAAPNECPVDHLIVGSQRGSDKLKVDTLGASPAKGVTHYRASREAV